MTSAFVGHRSSASCTGASYGSVSDTGVVFLRVGLDGLVDSQIQGLFVGMVRIGLAMAISASVKQLGPILLMATQFPLVGHSVFSTPECHDEPPCL